MLGDQQILLAISKFKVFSFRWMVEIIQEIKVMIKNAPYYAGPIKLKFGVSFETILLAMSRKSNSGQKA